jgi:streptogramin lyase
MKLKVHSFIKLLGGHKVRAGILLFVAIFLGLTVPGIARSSEPARAAQAATSAVLTGATRAAGGQKLEGVAVTARAAESTVTVTVYTDEQGNYVFPPLENGKYQVWAQAVGYEMARAEVTQDSTRNTRHEFTLQPIKDFTQQLSGPEWMDSLPGETRQDRRAKAIFAYNCTQCHPSAYPLQNQFDQKGWLAILNLMEQMGVFFWRGPDVKPKETIHYHKEELAAYLAKYRGPGAPPLKFKLLPRPKGDAARVVMTEYNIPPAETPDDLVAQDGNDWSEGIPSFGNLAYGTHDIAIDFNGNAWVSQGTQNRNRTFFKVDAKTGKVTAFKLPGENGFAQGTHGVTADQNGIIWFDVHTGGGVTGHGTLGRVDPATEKIEIFTPPPGIGEHDKGIGITMDSDPKGKIWTAADYGGIVFDPVTKKFTYYPAPTHGAGGYGIGGDIDGNGWWAHPRRDVVGYVDYKSGKISEIQLKPRRMEGIITAEDRKFYENVEADSATAPLGVQGPRRLAVDKRGTSVWVPDWWGQNLAKIDIHTHEVSYYDVPINAHPYFTAVDKNHAVWTALMDDDRVAKFDPKTEKWTLYLLPSRGCEARQITVDQHAENPEVWLPCYRNSKVIRLQFRTPAEIRVAEQGNGTGPLKAQN